MIDALRYEFVRLRTIRSTYWLVGLAVTFQLIMSMLIAWRMSVAADPPSGDNAFDILATIGASTGLAPLFIAYIIGLVGVFSMGHEYRHGMIRATLTALPSRGTVFAAKVVSTAIVSALAALGCIAIALAGQLIFGLDLPSGSELTNLTGGTVIFAVLFSLSGLAYAALTRNQTAAVALLMLVPTVVEQIIKAIILAIKSTSDDPRGTGGLVQILKYLPYDAGGQMYTRASIEDLLSFLGVAPFGPVGGGLVMAVFVGALLGGSYTLFIRRDA
ncbi:ABC transporter permease [Aeromicrobium sp.]|uniref:ABC transporter permease n=1 Tax=Aeromicrobium sp. TaxID=1871063 RepID=UPI0030BB54EC